MPEKTTVPAEMDVIPTWPEDLDPKLCKIQEDGDTDTIILSGLSIIPIKHALSNNLETALRTCAILPLEREWNTIRIHRKAARFAINFLIDQERQNNQTMMEERGSETFLNILTMISAVNVMGGTSRLSDDKETDRNIEQDAYARINGHFLSIAIADTKNRLASQIIEKVDEFRASFAQHRLGVIWFDAFSLKSENGTDIVIDLLRDTALGSNKNRISFTTCILDAIVKTQTENALRPNEGKTSQTCLWDAHNILKISIPSHSDRSEILTRQIHDGKEIDPLTLPIALECDQIVFHDLLLQIAANENFLIPTRKYFPVKPCVGINTTPVIVPVHAIATITDIFEKSLYNIKCFNGNLFQGKNKSTDNHVLDELVSISYDIKSNALSIRGVLVSCMRKELIDLAELHKMSGDLSLSPHGDGYNIKFRKFADDGIKIKDFVDDICSKLAPVADSITSNPFRYCSARAESDGIPTALRGLDGIAKIQPVEMNKTGRFRFEAHDIYSVKILDSEICNQVREDLIEMGWGWRRTQNISPNNNSKKHSTEQVLLMEGSTTLEYIVSKHMPGFSTILSLGKNRILAAASERQRAMIDSQMTKMIRTLDTTQRLMIQTQREQSKKSDSRLFLVMLICLMAIYPTYIAILNPSMTMYSIALNMIVILFGCIVFFYNRKLKT